MWKDGERIWAGRHIWSSRQRIYDRIARSRRRGAEMKVRISQIEICNLPQMQRRKDILRCKMMTWKHKTGFVCWSIWREKRHVGDWKGAKGMLSNILCLCKLFWIWCLSNALFKQTNDKAQPSKIIKPIKKLKSCIFVCEWRLLMLEPANLSHLWHWTPALPSMALSLLR